MRSSTLRAVTGAALTAGLLGATAGTAAAEEAHTVQPGETLADIAADYDGVTLQDIQEANELVDPSLIFPGQDLEVPVPPAEEAHEVESGETLAEIAGAYDHVASWRALADANADVITDPDILLPGQVLSLAGAESAPAAPAPEAEPQPETHAHSESEPAPEESTPTAGVWDQLAECESNGDWSADTGNSFYGGLQFTLESWESVGGSGYPHDASREEQIQRAEQLQASQGWDAWPACADQLGLR